MNRLMLLSIALFGLVLVLAGCGEAPAPARTETALEHAEKHLDPRYQCPMHPDVTSDAPGTCPICGMTLVPVATPATEMRSAEPLYFRHPHDPTITSPVPRKDEMGMDFVPVYGEGGTEEEGVIKLSPAMVNNLGVRTAVARRGRVEQAVGTVGTVTWDERGRVEVRVRTDGYVERLAVRAEGETVRRGQPLFAVFSPRLAAAQSEYLHALALGDPDLVEASASRLTALGLGRGQLQALRESRQATERVTYYSPIDGAVMSLGVRDGGLAEPGMSAMMLVPVDRLWVVADIPEAEAARVRAGDRARVTFSALPGEHFEAGVIEVLPQLNAATRTLQARLGVGNPDGRLAAGMLADVVIEGAPAAEGVLVPTEALIRTGRAERVILALGDGRFEAREVVSGRESGEEVEIRAGLVSGEVVVVSGQFMIDSESQVRQSLRRLVDPAAVPTAAPGADTEAPAAHAGKDHEVHEDPHAGHDHASMQEQGT
jgi:Cu(I)/Ag(I) efflux system membrane fusion protein